MKFFFILAMLFSCFKKTETSLIDKDKAEKSVVIYDLYPEKKSLKEDFLTTATTRTTATTQGRSSDEVVFIDAIDDHYSINEVESSFEVDVSLNDISENCDPIDYTSSNCLNCTVSEKGPKFLVSPMSNGPWLFHYLARCGASQDSDAATVKGESILITTTTATTSTTTTLMEDDYPECVGEPMKIIVNTIDDKSFKLGLDPNYEYNFLVDWGDGSTEEVSGENLSVNHEYEDLGKEYEIVITGVLPSWKSNETHQKIKSVILGETCLKDLSNSFNLLKNLETFSGGDVSKVETMKRMFAGSNKVIVNISNWDTKNVKDMSVMFRDLDFANPDVSGWNTENVVDMDQMFYNTKLANPDVSQWNTVNVEKMSWMFFNTELANPDVSSWDTSNLVYVDRMFYGAKSANPKVTNWNTAKIKNMSWMFYKAKIANPDVSQWNTGTAEKMDHMFFQASSAAPDVSSWDIRKVKSMIHMLNGSLANPDFKNWNLDSIESMAAFSNFPSSISIENYSKLLIQAAQSPSNNVVLEVHQKYNQSALEARNKLVNEKGWVITDLGLE